MIIYPRKSNRILLKNDPINAMCLQQVIGLQTIKNRIRDDGSQVQKQDIPYLSEHPFKQSGLIPT